MVSYFFLPSFLFVLFLPFLFSKPQKLTHHPKEPEPQQQEQEEYIFNPILVEELMGMGFPLVRVQKSILATTSSTSSTGAAAGGEGRGGGERGERGGMEECMNWIFSHMDDDG